MMHRKGKASGVLMLALAVFTGCSQTETKVGQTAQRRWRPIDNEKVQQARNAPAPKIAPETHYAAGVLLEQQGQPGQAIEQFRRAIALNHDYAEAYHRLGVLQGTTGQHVDAEQNLRKAVALKPQQAFFRNDLGFELMQQQDWAQAEEQFRAALDVYPRMPRANVNLGLALSQQGRFDEALACFRTALPEADAQYNLGLVYKQQQRYSEASECFRLALSERPLFTAAGTQLAICTQNMGGTQPTPLITQTTPTFAQSTTPAAAPQNEFISQRNDSTIPVTTSGEPRPRTMAAQTTPEETTPFSPPTRNPTPAPQQVEWIEVQTSNDAPSDDPITTPAPSQPQSFRAEPAPVQQATEPRHQSTFTPEPASRPMSRPEPMSITTSGPSDPAPSYTQRQSQPNFQAPPATSSRPATQPTPQNSGDVQFVPLSDVGDSRPMRTQPSSEFSPAAQPSSNFTPTVQPSPQSNAAPAGYSDETPSKNMTPDEFRTWQAERRAQAQWVEEQRTGQRAARKPHYHYESKYQTQIVTQQAGTEADTRSTMAATVYTTTITTNSNGQGPLPTERPFEWLDTVSHNNTQLEAALNNLRCESLYGPSEMDFSPADSGNRFESLQMTIVPPESPAMPLENIAPVQSRPTASSPSSSSSRMNIQSSGSGEKIVPMTDANSGR